MRKYSAIKFIVLTLSFLISACDSSSRQAMVVEEYLNALVSKDATQLSTLSCAEWAPYAATEMNSFQAVTATLQDLTCETTGTEGDMTLVVCGGTIATTYNDEQQQIDLSLRTYQVVEQGGEYLVCGYR